MKGIFHNNPKLPMVFPPRTHSGTSNLIPQFQKAEPPDAKQVEKLKVQMVYHPQQSQSLGESHPVPAQAPPAYKITKGRATEVPI